MTGNPCALNLGAFLRRGTVRRMSDMRDPVELCGCGHPFDVHDSDGCAEWWRYPEVLTARKCGCSGMWVKQ